MDVAELEGFKSVCQDKVGGEVLVWTSGGHYFRGNLEEISEQGFMVLKDVSCTLAGERQERELVFVSIQAIDAFS